MKEEILKLLPITPYMTMTHWLYHHNAEYINDFVEYFVLGEDNEYYEIDIWVDDIFIMARYDIEGTYIRHEEEKR